MKKLFSVIFIGILLLTLVGCSPSKNDQQMMNQQQMNQQQMNQQQMNQQQMNQQQMNQQSQK